MDTPKWNCALWYWRYNTIRVSLSTSEVNAAKEAVDMVEQEFGSPEGIQFKDGRVVNCADWTMYKELKDARSQELNAAVMATLAAEAKNPPPAPKIVKSPFDGAKATLHGEIPEWVGVE